MTKNNNLTELVSSDLPLEIQLLSSKKTAKTLDIGIKKLTELRAGGKISYVCLDDDEEDKKKTRGKTRKKTCKYRYRASAIKAFIDAREVHAELSSD